MEIINIYPLNIIKDILGEEEAKRVCVKDLMAEIAKLDERRAEV